MGLSEWTQTQDNYAPCEYRPGKTTTVEALNNGQNYIIYGYVSFFLQPPQCLLNDPMNKVALLAGMKVMHDLKNRDFLLSSLT